MSITRIRVGYEPPSAVDVLDYAEALIEEHGWNPKVKDGVESSDENGFSLHDAIGTACTRLSADVTRRGGTKDWSITTAEGVTKSLRTEAQALVNAEIVATSTHKNDYEFNDNAASVDDILAVLRGARAREEAASQ